MAFKQRKYAIPGDTLSPVGGFINNGESPFDAARREIWEELGVGSRHTKSLIDRHNGDAASILQHSKETKESPFGVMQKDAAVAAAAAGTDGNQSGGSHVGGVQHDEFGLAVGDVTDDEPDWIFLGRYRTMANRGGGFLYAYAVVNAVPLVPGGGTPSYTSTGDDEEQQLMLLSKEETRRAVETAQFQEIKWAGTMVLALMHIDKRGL